MAVLSLYEKFTIPFLFYFPPKPCQIVVENVKTSETITLEDVVFGDVWVCSGQSNQEVIIYIYIIFIKIIVSKLIHIIIICKTITLLEAIYLPFLPSYLG